MPTTRHLALRSGRVQCRDSRITEPGDESRFARAPVFLLLHESIRSCWLPSCLLSRAYISSLDLARRIVYSIISSRCLTSSPLPLGRYACPVSCCSEICLLLCILATPCTSTPPLLIEPSHNTRLRRIFRMRQVALSNNLLCRPYHIRPSLQPQATLQPT